MALTAIVILNYNNYEDTINCIESVEQYNTAPIKYIVVDNGSPRDGTVERLHEFLSRKFAQSYLRLEDDCNVVSQLPRMTFLVSKTNDGYARGNNKGLRLAKADEEVGQILILNNDILFVEDIIPTLTNKLNTLPQAGIVSPMLLKKDGKEIDYTCARTNRPNWEVIQFYYTLYKDPFRLLRKASESHFILKASPEKIQLPYVEIELPSGSCMLFRKELMEKIKLFDEGTFLYYEENIIFKQEKKLGLKNYLIPCLRCVHLGATAIQKRMNSFVRKAHTESSIHYLREYGDMNFFQNVVAYIGLRVMYMKCFLLRLSERLK